MRNEERGRWKNYKLILGSREEPEFNLLIYLGFKVWILALWISVFQNV